MYKNSIPRPPPHRLPGNYPFNRPMMPNAPPYPNYPVNRPGMNPNFPPNNYPPNHPFPPNHPMNNNMPPGMNPNYPMNNPQMNQPDEMVEIDPATYTANWMSGYYEPHPSNMLYISAIYEDYVNCCKEIKRQGVIDLTEFTKVLRYINYLTFVTLLFSSGKRLVIYFMYLKGGQKLEFSN